MPADEQKASAGATAWIGLVVRMGLFPVALMLPAGTWRWGEAWALVGIWVAFIGAVSVYMTSRDPELVAERLKASPAQEGQKAWDKVLMILMFAAGLGIFVVPGFDVVRFGWSEPLPLWLEIVALAAHVPCFLFITWVMRENTFLARVVKIDEERGHQVITTGPYAIVRHPMYTAVIVIIFAVPVALGSRFGLIPATLMAALLVVRTWLEDRTLHSELAGYVEYARNTRYRLVPGVW